MCGAPIDTYRPAAYTSDQQRFRLDCPWNTVGQVVEVHQAVAVGSGASALAI